MLELPQLCVGERSRGRGNVVWGAMAKCIRRLTASTGFGLVASTKAGRSSVDAGVVWEMV